MWDVVIGLTTGNGPIWQAPALGATLAGDMNVHDPVSAAIQGATSPPDALSFAGATDCGVVGLTLARDADAGGPASGAEQVLRLAQAEPLIAAVEQWLQSAWDPAPVAAAGVGAVYQAVVRDPALAPPGTRLHVPLGALLVPPPAALRAPALAWSMHAAQLVLGSVPLDALPPLQAGIVTDHAATSLGPLAGFCAALERCTTPWLLTVPCDSPLLPLDLAARLAQAAVQAHTDLAMVLARTPQDCVQLRPQPVFCLLHQRLLPSLQHYLHTGGHTIRAWADTHRPAWAVFEQPHDHPLAFYNANTLQELQQLEQWCAPPSSPP